MNKTPCIKQASSSIKMVMKPIIEQIILNIHDQDVQFIQLRLFEQKRKQYDYLYTNVKYQTNTLSS